MTKRQEDLVAAFMVELGDAGPLYHELILHLAELGYTPQKEKSNLSFKHDLHNKQMAKMGIKTTKATGPSPFFALRFSACRGYSQRFADIVAAYMAKYPTRAARCTSGGCLYCKGAADTHVYTQPVPGGESKTHCGAYAIEIPGIVANDIAEIKKLIQEEHAYLLKQEVGISSI